MTISRTHFAYATLAALVLTICLTTRVWLGWMLDAATAMGMIR